MTDDIWGSRDEADSRLQGPPGPQGKPGTQGVPGPSVTLESIGLDRVDNTSDSDKTVVGNPIGTALAGKAPATYIAHNEAIIARVGNTGTFAFNTDTNRLHVQNGQTAGGVPIAAIEDVDRVRKTMPNDGLIGDGLSARRFIITSDQRDAREWNSPENLNGYGFGMGQRIAHTVGGPSLFGGRIATLSTMIHEAPDNPANNLPQFVGLTGSAYGFSQGGFGGTSQNPRGGLFGGNSYVEAISGYTNVHNITSHEFNNYIHNGASVDYNTCIQIVPLGPIRGRIDAAISVGGNGTTYGILFSDMHAYGTSPIDANGAIIGTYKSAGGRFAAPITYGIDFRAFKFVESILKVDEYDIRGNGSVKAGNKTVAGQINYDFLTSGQNDQFDVRLAATGGSLNPGQGTFDVVAALTRISGAVEFANVPRAPTVVGTYTIAADKNVLVMRFCFDDGIYRAVVAMTKE